MRTGQVRKGHSSKQFVGFSAKFIPAHIRAIAAKTDARQRFAPKSK